MPNYQKLGTLPAADKPRTLTNLLALRKALDEIPEKMSDGNLLLATWNIREFDKPAYGKRIPEAMYYIAEIVARFDLIAIQEVYKDLTALKELVEILGPNYTFIVTDASGGDAGNDERLAYVFDTRKIKFGGVAGEIVLPSFKEKDATTGQTIVVTPKQLARTPFMCGFEAGWTNFQLTTVHILFGDNVANDPNRIAEIKKIATALAARTNDQTEWSRNMILLGDFNIFSKTDDTLKAITDAGFVVPQQLQNLPSNVLQNKFYDQIAVFDREQKFVFSGLAGVFNFTKIVFKDEDEAIYAPLMGEAYNTTDDGKPRKNKSTYYKTYWRTHQMSDHLPMWTELKIDFSDGFLQKQLTP